MVSWWRNSKEEAEMKTRSNSGFTLVELLVAVALGLVILAGLFQTFRTQHDTYIVQDQVAAMQQNLRAAMYLITRDLQMAGWYTNFDRSNRTIDLGDDLGPTTGRPLFFSEDNSGGGSDGTIRQGTDALVIMKAGNESRTLTAGESASGTLISLSTRDLGSGAADLDNNAKKYGLLVKSDLRAADLFVVDSPSGTITNEWDLDENYLSGDLVFRADIIIYKIEDEDGRPLLRRKNLGNDTGYQVVAENIENMQIRYQLSNGNWVDELTNNQAQVRAVEVVLVGRTAQRQRGYTDTNTYDFANNTGALQNPMDNFRRKVLSTVVKTRNVGL